MASSSLTLVALAGLLLVGLAAETLGRRAHVPGVSLGLALLVGDRFPDLAGEVLPVVVGAPEPPGGPPPVSSG